MKLSAIGFTRSSAAHFFGRLKAAGTAVTMARLIDVRLTRTSQLAGFAKERDLAFFARELCGIETAATPALALHTGTARRLSQGRDRLAGLRGALRA